MRLLLVRHALCDPVGVSLAGRAPGVPLNAAGRAQLAPLVERVRRRLGDAPPDAVLASPLARARETAAAVARAYALGVTAEPALVEIDFGRWTGRRLDALGDDAEWGPFNGYRSGTPAGGAELALAAQARAVGALLARAREAPHATLVAVSHADVLKAVVGHLLGVPLDLQQRIEIAPASVSEVELSPWGARVLALNDVA